MSISRILAIVVVGALLVVAGLTVYNAVGTAAVVNNNTSLLEQRRGEWLAGEADSVGDKLDQHERHPGD